MSRSNPNEQLVNPSTRFIEWKGGEGKFTYYDKEAKKNIDIPLPFRFIVLEQLSTVKGYSDADSSGFWSNEVRDLATEQLVVRTKGEKFPPMLYEQVKEKLSSRGAEYCKSVYIGYYDAKKKLTIGNIGIKGCAIGPWIEFCKVNKVMEIGVQVKGSVEGKKGATKFHSPVFEPLAITPETNASAIELDKVLQEYLTAYFKNAKKEVVEAKTQHIATQEAISATPFTDAVKNDVDVPVDDESDLPF